MKIITVINAKGGCGKSTIATSLASGLALRGRNHATLLIDMDPQAQITQWLGLGDGLSPRGTLVEAMEGTSSLASVIQPTRFANLSFVASSQQLEELGRQITDTEGYQTILTRLLASLGSASGGTADAGVTGGFEFVVIDSPNQISPVMENCIYPSDLFVVPFESTKAVRSYANFFALLMRLRPELAGAEAPSRVLHVMSNLSRQRGLRQRVIENMEMHGIPRAKTEVRTCGWLAQVDENGGSIFDFRPHSNGAADMALLVEEVLELLAREDRTVTPPAVTAEEDMIVKGIINQSHDQAA